MTRFTAFIPALALAAFTLTFAPAAQAGDSCTASKDDKAAQKTMTADDTKAKPAGTIVETAVASEDFTTLVAAVKAAELVDTLNGEGPFTVFAPTDDAFAKLPEGTVDGLLRNIPELQKILTFHVVPGKVMAGDLTDEMTAKTVQGGALKFDLTDGAMVNGAKIVVTDIQCSNGVIHVIDTVLLP